MAYKQRSSGLPFKQLGSSPVKQEVDTTWADKVYDPKKVDETLVKRGLHTDKRVGRGTVNTSTGDRDRGINNAFIDQSTL
jgi:hypothetical protein